MLRKPEFLGATGPRTLFAIKCSSGRNIARYSSYVNEKEILLLSGTCLRVENSMVVPGSDGLAIINMEEVKLPSGVKLIK